MTTAPVNVPTLTTAAAPIASNLVGDLAGRLATPLSFYLLCATSVLGVVATVAFAILSVWQSMAIAALFTITQLIAVFTIYRTKDGTAKEVQDIADKLMQENTKLQDLAKEQAKQLSTFSTNVTGFVKESDQFEQVVKSLDTTTSSLDKDISSKVEALSATVKELTNYNDSEAHQKLLTNLQELIDFVEGKKDPTLNQILEIANSYKTLIEQNKTIIDELKKSNSTLEDSNKKLEKVNKDSNKLLENLQSEKKNIEEASKKLQESNQSLTSTNQELTTKIADLEASIHEITSLNTELAASVKAFADAVNKQKELKDKK